MIDMLGDYEDMKTCFTFANMISTGRVARYLEKKKAVPMHEAHWRNHTMRIMSFFCRTRRPSPALITLVTFNVQAYVLLSWKSFLIQNYGTALYIGLIILNELKSASVANILTLLL